jgi:hypothetical protein
VNRAERRRGARQGTPPIVKAVQGAEAARARAEADLWAQAHDIRLTSPSPGETPAEALAAVDAFLAELDGPQYEFVAGRAIDELRLLRTDLLTRLGAG